MLKHTYSLFQSWFKTINSKAFYNSHFTTVVAHNSSSRNKRSEWKGQKGDDKIKWKKIPVLKRLALHHNVISCLHGTNKKSAKRIKRKKFRSIRERSSESCWRRQQLRWQTKDKQEVEIENPTHFYHSSLRRSEILHGREVCRMSKFNLI